MQSPNLHVWIKNCGSNILFINGNFNPSAHRSPLSFVCAKLIDSIHPSPSSQESEGPPLGIIAQAFFCGQHLTSKDPDAGVAGLMRSLISQVLAKPNCNFTVSIIDRLSHISLLNVTELSAIYQALVMQLPAQTTVFCIIDALTFHEDNKIRCRDALTVVQTLADLTDRCDGESHCVFKALLTCPGNSRALYKELSKEDVVWMPKKVSAQGGFTSMKWTASAGKDLSEVGRQDSW